MVDLKFVIWKKKKREKRRGNGVTKKKDKLEDILCDQRRERKQKVCPLMELASLRQGCNGRAASVSYIECASIHSAGAKECSTFCYIMLRLLEISVHT